MTDSHAHLGYEPIFSQLDNLLEEYINSGGKHILNVSGILVDSIKNLSISRKYRHKFPGLIQTAIGIHPESFFEEREFEINRAEKEIKKLSSMIDKYRDELDAIGESGIDYHSFTKSNIPIIFKSVDEIEIIKEIQQESFRAHVQKSLEYDLPISIHSRDRADKNESVKDALEIVCQVGKGKIRGSFHCYTGKKDYVEDIINLGLHIGFNAIITYKSGENVREILRKTPMNRILLETDAPFLPLRTRDKRANTPLDIKDIAKVAAEIKDCTTEKLLEITRENYENLFLIKDRERKN
ncbi:MAG TPA: TatD family deoxyribonuclease [bacterium]|nr:TatD family deoxyribonuclease [bacterium]